MKPNQQTKTSADLYAEACQLIPGGVSRNTIFHQPHPEYAAFAAGCRVTDRDGVERIDFANNMAAMILGHAHPELVRAVTEQIAKGTAYTMATEAELDLARLITQRNPGFERIRFTNSGTEAVMAMIKTARAFTGKPMIAKAEGAYHGTYDFAEVSQAPNPTTWGDPKQPNSVPLAFGTPKGVLENVAIFPFNDLEHTLQILEKNKDKLACVLLDPIPHRVGLTPVDPDYLERIYQWTRQNKVLLVFDEVVTFRVNYGGAQTNYPVRPDLTALGKIIGGGFPVGAFTGRSDIMQVLDPGQPNLLLPYSGTFSANPVTMTAGRVTMSLYDEQAVSDLNQLTSMARQQLEDAVRVAGVPVSFTGAGSMLRMHFRTVPPTSFREAYQPKPFTDLSKKVLDYLFYEERIMMVNTMTCMFSTAISQAEVDHLSESYLRMFRKFKSDIHNLQNLYHD